MSTDDLLSRRPRTKRVFSEADMARMRDLYYDPAVPMPDAADAFGVPVSTLMRWIAEMRWPRKSTGWRPAGMAAVSPDKFACENKVAERFGGQKALELMVPAPSIIPSSEPKAAATPTEAA
jgi:hypothetical protein